MLTPRFLSFFSRMFKLVAFLEIALGKKMEREGRQSFIFTCLHNLLSYHSFDAVGCTLVPRSKIENPRIRSVFSCGRFSDLKFYFTDPGQEYVEENSASNAGDGGEATVVTVEGGRADLPCDIEAKSQDDSVYLVLWYRKNSGTPIYRFVVTFAQILIKRASALCLKIFKKNSHFYRYE